MPSATRLALVVLVVLCLPSSAAWVLSGLSPTERVSISSEGEPGNHHAGEFGVALSADGRLVAYDSRAGNLVQGDRNDKHDVFLFDRITQETIRVSVSSAGIEANEGAKHLALSADGRVAAFCGMSSNLVPGDTNDRWDVFVHDLETGETARASVGVEGRQANATSSQVALSRDGSVVAYCSEADNLVLGDDNGAEDIYVRDRVASRTERVSVGPGGIGADRVSRQPAVSADGRYVVFCSLATNLVPGVSDGECYIYVRDRESATTTCVSRSSAGALANGQCTHPSISGDGRHVVFESLASNLVPDDHNDTVDVFVHDRQTGQTTRASVTPSGTESHASTGCAMQPAISADGRMVVFCSDAEDLFLGDPNGMANVFVHDLATGETTRASVSAEGDGANGRCAYPALSADGRSVAFASNADNLVVGDINGRTDVFCRDLWEASPTATLTATVTGTPTPTRTPIAAATPTTVVTRPVPTANTLSLPLILT